MTDEINEHADLNNNDTKKLFCQLTAFLGQRQFKPN